MEENNKKGFNSLYLVLGVATLVVAIVGATFAYFSASQTNNNITGNIAEAGGLVLDVKSITYDPSFATTGNSIIPLDLIAGNTVDDEEEAVDAGDQFTSAINNKCIDDLGNNICEVYKITVTNQSETSTVQIRGTLSLTSNATNMYWKQINATTTTTSNTVGEGEEAVTTNYEILDTATEVTNYVAVKQGTEDGNYLTVDENGAVTNISLTGGASKVFYVIVWLEEMGTAQESVDASTTDTPRTYSGTVTFDAVDANGNKSGVTATFLS